MAERARRAAEVLGAGGAPVRFLRSVYVPEDDTCFLLYEAPAEDIVAAALARAGLRAGRLATTLAAAEAPPERTCATAAAAENNRGSTGG